MLRVEGINTFYGAAQILFDLSLSIERGETVCLLGRNGAGKTTTLRSIMGLTSPATGRISFNGEDITGKPSFVIAQRGIGFVPEDRRIFSSLTVRRNLDIGAKKGSSGNGLAEWTEKIIFEHFPQLAKVADRVGECLSGGERQMLAIARTLMGNPELVLLDEPTEGLAPLMVQEVIRIIQTLKEKGMSILLVEQHPKALSIADRVYVMSKGEMVYEGDAKEILDDAALKQRLLGI